MKLQEHNALKIEQKNIDSVIYERLGKHLPFNSITKQKCELCEKLEMLFEIKYKDEVFYLCGKCINDITISENQNALIKEIIYETTKK